MSGTLYLVATPIGNLGDISARAAKTFSDVDFVAAEDTRVTLKLLRHLDIKKELISYHEHNRRESGEQIIGRLQSGENCALATDAGTPGISDPGEDIVRMCIESGIKIVPVPGPCAAVTALSVSGLPAGRFVFEGFLPIAKKSRFELLNDLKTEKRTMVFYEAPHKLMRTLNDMLDVFGERSLSISRELTKLHEETLHFTLYEAIAHFEQTPPRGELALIVEGAKKDNSSNINTTEATALVNTYINDGLSVKDAVKKAAEETGLPKNTLYKAAVKVTSNK